jgi:hypothetical protein
MRPEDLIDAACAATGLSDFGDDSWREGFDVLLRSVADDAALSPQGDAVVAGQITAMLRNRLEIEDWHKRHPEIAEERIVQPLIGMGLPRTGSTALGTLLGLDPARRSLRKWEAGKPCPPPTPASASGDPRVALADAVIAEQLRLFPDYAGMLPQSANAATECIEIMTFEFRSQLFDSMVKAPAYGTWVVQCDMVKAYEYHRRTLQLLQWRCPPTRWSLRTPCHMYAVDALDTVYPDARFIMTHRDITSVMPSAVAMIAALSLPMSEKPDMAYVAAHVADMWDRALRTVIAFRDAGNDHRFFDVDFREAQSAPIDVIRRLYDWLGDELSAEAEDNMVRWWKENAEDRQPARYRSPAEYGIDLDEIAERFAFYSERFGIPAAVRNAA